MNNTLQNIEEEILVIGQRLNEEVFENYTSGRITLQQLENAYRMLSKWSSQGEMVIKTLEENSG